MGSRPSGIVTFLFTDIAGSTAIWEQHPQQMRTALPRHDEVVRGEVHANRGVVFATGGDGFAIAFGSADDALGAAIAMQATLLAEEWPQGVDIRVRMGLHTGDAEERDGDYFGPHVNRAARVSSAANGGQIVVSDATARAMTSRTHIRLTDKGFHRLKGVPVPVHIHGVVVDGLHLDDQPLRVTGTTSGNLPALLPPLIGRDAQIEALTHAVHGHRLVSLTGVGGVGKTSLAQHVAAGLVALFPDGVWFVDLAALTDGRAIAHAIAATIGLTQQPGLAPADSLVSSLVERRALVILDNCEHLLDDAAALTDRVLARAPDVSIIATTREELGCVGEQVWPVPPLEHAGEQSSAVELFVERARAGVPTFDPEPHREVVAEICGRLDGLPLAIELAAARVRSLTPTQLRDRLIHRFDVLTRNERGRLGRHQTLAETVRWSFDLLTDEERAVLCRLSVFSGGFLLDAAEGVTADSDVPPARVYDVLDSLVRKSLVTVDATGAQVRYGLLETIREFGEHELEAQGALTQVRDRHAAYFAVLAERNLERFCSPAQADSFAWFATELANIRTGVQWSVSRGDITTAARTAISSGFIAYWRENYEPVLWAEQLLPAARAAGLRSVPSLLASAANCAWLGRVEEARQFSEEALACLGDTRFDPDPHAWEHVSSSLVGFFSGRVDLFRDALAAGMGRPEDGRMLANRMWHFWSLSASGLHAQARAIATESMSAAERTGIPWTIIASMHGYGRAFADIDPTAALTAYRRGIALAQSSSNRWWYVITGSEMGVLETRAGDPANALKLFSEILPFVWESGNTVTLFRVFVLLIEVFDRLERLEAAAALLGLTRNHAALSAPDVDLTEVTNHIRARLGQADFERLVAEGASLSSGVAVDYVQDEILSARLYLARVTRIVGS